jgi:hypothetical protein
MRVCRQAFSLLLIVAFAPLSVRAGTSDTKAVGQSASVGELISAISAQAKVVENSAGTRAGFDSLNAEYRLAPGTLRFSDYVIAHLVYEATRDAGFWGMHWAITNQPPNSDAIWTQWRVASSPSFAKQTATAECDELSALYAFLVERAGVHGVGLFWPYPNHTVAVWTLHPAPNSFVRVVVPTSQIFLTEADDFGTKSFNPWTQKTIYEYTRRDAPDSLEIPRPLFDFFVAQMKKYGGATDGTLQKIRYMRDAAFRGEWTPEEAARAALQIRAGLSSASPEDSGALQYFAQDMRSASLR